MRNDEVREYYDLLSSKRGQLLAKRLFDVVMSVMLIVIMLIPMFVISVIVMLDSPGGAMFRQERVTTNGRIFRIHKFRTMSKDASQSGSLITTEEDSRITKVGKKLRKYRLDELPQLFDILVGNMSFVGTRAEVSKYVNHYTREMYATLLLPAGLTSEASIRFKDEAELLTGAENTDELYIKKILPQKMVINLESLRKFSIARDVAVMIRTVAAVIEQ